jgi:hypothetical protein
MSLAIGRLVSRALADILESAHRPRDESSGLIAHLALAKCHRRRAMKRMTARGEAAAREPWLHEARLHLDRDAATGAWIISPHRHPRPRPRQAGRAALPCYRLRAVVGRCAPIRAYRKAGPARRGRESVPPWNADGSRHLARTRLLVIDDFLEFADPHAGIERRGCV